MTAGELKVNREELIKWIKNLNNEKLIGFLNNIRITENRKKNIDWWDDLSDSEINDINRGLEEVSNGDTLSSSEFWNQIKS